jgi:hypothetical protein
MNLRQACLSFAAVLIPLNAFAADLTVEAALAKPVINASLALEEAQVFVESRIVPMPDLGTLAEWESYAEKVRQDVFEQVVFTGEARQWRTMPTRVEWQGTIEGGPGYKIRKLRFEVVPGMWAAALLYEPDHLEGKVPVVMNVNGHDRPQGKAADYKQLRCINQAKRGMIALNVEWLGMGQLQSDGFSHYSMNQMNLCGTSGLAPFYLIMSRGLDILLQHQNADPSRVAVAGLSGGGWQTIFISSLDTRVTLCNPVAGYSSFRTRARFLRDLGDSEQTPCDFAAITDYAQLTAMLAPRAVLLTKNAEDSCCFRAEHALPPLLDAARPVYRLYGKPDHLRYHINHDPGDHNFGLDNRQQFYRMLGDFFHPDQADFDAKEIPSESELKTKEELFVELPDHNLDFNSKALELSGRLLRSLPANAGELVAWQAEQRPLLKKIVRADSYDVLPIIQLEESSEVLTARYRWLRFGGDWTAPAVELVPTGAAPKKVAILLADAGRSSVTRQATDLLEDGYRVLAMDPLYFGEAKIAERDFLFAIMVASTGKRMLGIQAEQVRSTADWAKRHFECDTVTVVAVGPRTSLIALTATGLAESEIDNVELHQSRGSLNELIEENLGMDKVPEALCFDLLRHFDIVQLVATAGPAKVHFADASERCRVEMKRLLKSFPSMTTKLLTP